MTIDNNDLINGVIELFAAALSLLNVRIIMRDKAIRGVSWVPTLFFTAWGCWNLYYYPSLDQICSFIGGLFIFAVNMVWLYLVFHYRIINKRSII